MIGSETLSNDVPCQYLDGKPIEDSVCSKLNRVDGIR